MNDQHQSCTDERPTTADAKERIFSFSIKKTFLLILSITIVASGWFYVRESARQNERRQVLDQPQEDIEGADQTDDTHPLDPILKIAYQSIKRMEENLVDYTAVLSRRERIGAQEMPPSSMEVKIRNPRDDQAFSIYVKFTKPENTKGREVIWVEGQNDNKIVAHESGLLGLFKVVQAPDSFVAMVGNRYPVTETGLLRLMQKLTQYGLRDRKHGDCDVQIIKNIQVAEVDCTRLRIVHPHKQEPFTFHIAEIDMDMERMIPIRLATWDWPLAQQEPPLVEEYIYHKLRLNAGRKDLDFDPENPAYNYPD